MPIQKTDADSKMEILINLAFGVSQKSLAKRYNMSEDKIVNLRKNNYKLYNQICEEFYIIDDVAILGMSPLYERAINILARFYRDRFVIQHNPQKFFLKGIPLNMSDIIAEANNIIAKDNIPALETFNTLKNYYISNKKK